jgi:hypothetical protein
MWTVTLTDSGRKVDGFDSERLDCTVRAIASCFGISYTDAHARLAALGRQSRHTFSLRDHADALGLTQITFNLLPCTFATVSKKLQQGRYIVSTAHHVFAVVDGFTFDVVAPSPRLRVKMIWQWQQSHAARSTTIGVSNSCET